MRSISIKLFVFLFLFGVVDLFSATYYIVGSTATLPDMSWGQFATQVINGNSFSNDTVVLTTDISVGNQMVGDDNNYFQGYFDGNNKKITVNISSNATNVGLFSRVGYVSGTSSSHIVHLTVDGTISGGSSSTNVGGFVGNAMSPFDFFRCTNLADVSGYSNVGGIVGGSTVGSTSIGGLVGLHFCVNQGSISGRSVGGIVGSFVSAGIIVGCKNSGTIIGAGETQLYMGGIVGYLLSGHATITNAVNIGRILSSNSQYAGGIVGYLNLIGGFVYCTNAGIVDGATTCVGGIIGYCANTQTDVANNININFVSRGSSSYYGSIIGLNNSVRIQDCYFDNQICPLGVGTSGVGYGRSTVQMLGNNLGSPISSSSTPAQLYPLPGCMTAYTDLHPIELLAMAPMYLMNNEKVNNITTFPFYVSNYNSSPPFVPSPPAQPIEYLYQWTSFSNGTIINVPASPSNNVTKNNIGQDTLIVKIGNEPYEKVVPVNAP